MKPVFKIICNCLKLSWDFSQTFVFMVAFFLEGILKQQSLWFLGRGGYFLEMSPIPYLRHQPARELRLTTGSWRPMGTSCPSRPGGRTMTSMATWTMLCTTATSTLSSTTTWSGRHEAHFALAVCPCLGFGVEHFFAVYLFGGDAWILASSKENRRLDMWVRNVLLCLSRGLRCSHILVFWSNLSANVFIWSSNKHLHNKAHDVQMLGNLSRYEHQPSRPFAREAAASPTDDAWWGGGEM